MARKPATYQDMFLTLLVQGYIIIMNSEEGAIKERISTLLEDLMSDAELYGWECTRVFHGVWLNQLEQGRTTLPEGENLDFNGLWCDIQPLHLPLPPPLPGHHGTGCCTSSQLSSTPQSGLVQRPVWPTMRMDVRTGAHTRMSNTSAVSTC